MTTPTPTIFLPYHALDEVIQRGLRADQPAAAEVVPGTLYSVTDESNRLERSDGAAWALYAPTGGAGGAPDPHHATHEPGGSDALVDVAWTDAPNIFAADQTVDGDLFVTGTVNPLTDAQRDQINALTGEEGGARTLMSSSFVSGLSLRHDEAVARGRIACGNYDTQTYQPLAFEVEALEVHTGISPASRVEHVRVHPLGGVTVGEGAEHDTDPGLGMIKARGLDGTPLNATQLLSGTVPDARLSANVQLKPIAAADLPAHAARHQPGGTDALTALDAGTITTGTLADARLSGNVALENVANTFTDIQRLASASFPRLKFTKTDQAVDQKDFELINVGATLYLQAVNEAGTVASGSVALDRVGNLFVSNAVYERSRSAAIGQWTAYTPSIAGTAGSLSGGTRAASYTEVGKTVLVNLEFTAMTVSGMTGAIITVTIPQVIGVVGGSRVATTLAYHRAGVWATAVAYGLSGDSHISIYAGTTGFGDATDLYLWGQIAIPIA